MGSRPGRRVDENSSRIHRALLAYEQHWSTVGRSEGMRRAILLLTVLAATSQGGPGNDVVLGTDGTDELGGGYGSDTIIGLGGKDYLYGGDLWLPGSEAPPPEVGPNNDDIMTGGTDNDLLWGNMGSDRIVGGTGDDILLDGESAGGAYDILIGGTG